MIRSLTVDFDSSSKTMNITGSGDISWKDTVMFHEVTEHIVIHGNGVYCTNGSNLFANFKSLIDIKGTINTSNCKDMSYFYSYCLNLTQPISDLDTSSAEEFDYFHNDNEKLTYCCFNSTKEGFKFTNMFKGCEKLLSIKGVTIPKDISLNLVSDNINVINLLST